MLYLPGWGLLWTELQQQKTQTSTRKTGSRLQATMDTSKTSTIIASYHMGELRIDPSTGTDRLPALSPSPADVEVAPGHIYDLPPLKFHWEHHNFW